MSTEEQFDCVVIGSGPGGYVAAIRAAQLGMKTAVIEKDKIGGRCLNYACIPAKAVLRAADVLTEVREAGQFGVQVSEPAVDFHAVQDRRRSVIETLTGGVSGLLKKNTITTFQGEASVVNGGQVVVQNETSSQELQAKNIILATGSVKKALPMISFTTRIIGTEEAWALSELPTSIAVLGAGASGSEIASAYARLGSKVTLIEAADRVLPTEDSDISRIAERQFKKDGIDVRTNVLVDGAQENDQSVQISLGEETIEAQWLVIATGRTPDTESLNLTAAGIKCSENGQIVVNERLQTSVASIYAIGDLVRGPALAHKASEEGVIAAETAAGNAPHPLHHVDIPRATFCAPNVGSFGLTQAQAKEQGYDVVVGKVPYGAVGAGTVYGDRTGMVKLVGERKYGELLGGHIVGSKATEMIQQLVNVRELEGGIPEIARIVHGHPTLSEAVLEAARAAEGWLIHG